MDTGVHVGTTAGFRAAKRWNVEVFIGEHEGKTRAEARLHTAEPTSHIGIGTARLNPTDSDVPEIGDELAVARALSDLSHQLLDARRGADRQLHARTGPPDELNRCAALASAAAQQLLERRGVVEAVGDLARRQPAGDQVGELRGGPVDALAQPAVRGGAEVLAGGEHRGRVRRSP